VTDDIAPHFKMKNLVDLVSAKLGGRGGGKDNFAQIGGADVSGLTEPELKRLATEHLKTISIVV